MLSSALPWQLTPTCSDPTGLLHCSRLTAHYNMHSTVCELIVITSSAITFDILYCSLVDMAHEKLSLP